VKFISLKVENLFAYNGPSEVDLSKTNAQRNIVVVSGRNGAGKTSLLNAVKLLFLGPNNETLRRVGFGNATLNAKQYVLGQPGRWYGVLNAAARASVGYVSLEWSDRGQTFRARRTFRSLKNGTDWEEDFSVTVDGTPLAPKAADATMHQLVPQEVIPFFFFDGEQIQALADAEIGREQTEIERLLGLSFMVHMIERIDLYAKEKARAGLPDEVRVRVVAAENAAREANARAEAHGRSRVQEEEGRIDLERMRDRLRDDRDRLRSGTLSESEKRRIEARLSVLEGEKEELALRIAEDLPKEVPFLTNERLSGDAFRLLDDHFGRATDNSVAGRLHRDLPKDVAAGLAKLDPPVKLAQDQRAGLDIVVRSSLERHGVIVAPANPLLQSLSPKRAAILRDQFLVWSQRGAILLRDHREQLTRMRRINSELRKLNQELDEAELTTDEAKAQYQELTDELTRVDAELEAAISRIAEHRIEEQRALREAAEQEDRAADLEAEHRDVARQNDAYKLAIRAKRALERYRELRKAEVRAAIERRLNERVAILLAPSELIRSVRLDDDFVMSYFDERKNEVARHSISAGMRQLLAMAMLWALKDEAQRPLPVIVDTPLGRIDRTNRLLLMREYFPQAGNPLILLPTDSELGPGGFEELADHIAVRYRIENEGGDSARIVEEPLRGASQ